MAVFGGCSHGVVIDTSQDAFAAGDMTMSSSCESAPGDKLGLASGVDSCRFTDGDKMQSSWNLVAPKPKSALQVTGGTIDIYYRDVHRSYPISDWLIPIPFKDIFNTEAWSADQNQVMVEALITLNWIDNQNIAQVTRYRGFALVLVLKQGYERLPIDSGNAAWGTTCKVQYSTAGRGAIKCQ